MYGRWLLRMLQWAVWLVLRLLLACRYRVRLVGLDEVLRKPGPYLILPNHPAYADPPNLIAHLWPAFRMRPVLLDSIFRHPLLAPFRWIFRGISIPDFQRPTPADRERIEAAKAEIIASLQRGESVILWPSGRLSRDGREWIGGARLAAEVLAAVPQVTVVLVRTRGLWGSMFSWANGQPRLFAAILKAFLLWLANLFVLAPRRKVTVTLEAFLPEERPEPVRERLNPWLQAWYNADVEREEPTFVPYHFLFGPRTHTFPAPVSSPSFDWDAIRPPTRVLVAQVVEEKLKRPLTEAENQPQTTFLELGIDSLDVAEITLKVERITGHSSGGLPGTLGELWAIAEGLQEQPPPPPAPPPWFTPIVDDTRLSILGETIAEAFLHQAFQRRREVIVADDRAGVLTYERLLVGASALSARFRLLPEQRVGLLLPASVGCDLAILGLYLAGKVPVLLNWTTGPAALGHAVRLTGLRQVVTSRLFLERVSVEIPGIEWLYLEDIRASISRYELWARLLAVRLLPQWYHRRLHMSLPPQSLDPEQTAVILFTSGSEKAPKAVPLTHRNILSDQRACLEALQLHRRHSALGFLPMFHSFGFTITGLLPLFVAVRIVHHPDPTDATALVRKIATYRPSIIATTPTFLSFLLDRAKPGDLESLQLIIVGAEKCPLHLFDRVRHLAPNAQLLEGYGVTECSPVVSVNRPGRVRPGTIGEPLPGISVRIVDPETHELLPPQHRGLLLVAGPIVFPGYLGDDTASPFLYQDGKRWYNTGDLAEQTDDGFLIFHGRLKRFLKVGGEMISLPALEEPFSKRFPPTPDGPRAAVEGIETPEGRRIVLFTTEPLTLQEANAILQEEGFRGLYRLDEVRRLDKLPVLGTGKTDYKVLRRCLEAEIPQTARISL
ncbi:MAG: AMP-binding protein [Thermogemmata sp.]|uniref:AMP-binding protein n=1 Tax=Thermogemmata fonticola TaxID=2755323 RepID=A0A7V9AAE8_9BACT|nr:AMP-binding protein [Thermogemmata fonticola]MBA2224829.1 AMP-binding protein [Thermogemmata fonticola]MCX8138885.1 AMP-binding protein [Gemmataceae bacterium]